MRRYEFAGVFGNAHFWENLKFSILIVWSFLHRVVIRLTSHLSITLSISSPSLLDPRVSLVSCEGLDGERDEPTCSSAVRDAAVEWQRAHAVPCTTPHSRSIRLTCNKPQVLQIHTNKFPCDVKKIYPSQVTVDERCHVSHLFFSFLLLAQFSATSTSSGV